jgi:hypothetical protein
MDGGDWVLLAIVAYVAVVALARLMLRRRSQLVEELLAEAARQRGSRPDAEPTAASGPGQTRQVA